MKELKKKLGKISKRHLSGRDIPEKLKSSELWKYAKCLRKGAKRQSRWERAWRTFIAILLIPFCPIIMFLAFGRFMWWWE